MAQKGQTVFLCPICCLSARERRDAYSLAEYKVRLLLEEDKSVFTCRSGKKFESELMIELGFGKYTGMP